MFFELGDECFQVHFGQRHDESKPLVIAATPIAPQIHKGILQRHSTVALIRGNLVHLRYLSNKLRTGELTFLEVELIWVLDIL